MSIPDREQIALDLFLTFELPHASHYTAHLLRLIMKADGVNRHTLAKAYPLHVEMFQEWWDTPNPKDFYDRYNVHRHYRPEREAL
jgi:hypothetical protein